MNTSLNKIEFTPTIPLNELQRVQNLTMGEGKEMEANVVTTKKEFMGGLSPKTKVEHSQRRRRERRKLPRTIRERKL